MKLELVHVKDKITFTNLTKPGNAHFALRMNLIGEKMLLVINALNAISIQFGKI